MFIIKRLLPIIIVFALIGFLTLQSPEDTLRLSYGMQNIFLALFPNASGRWAFDMHWFRTLLHLPLYFLLGGIVSFAVPKFWKAAGICFAVALADETLKIFLPTREFGATDLAFDAIGFLLGIGIVTLCRVIKKKCLKNR